MTHIAALAAWLLVAAAPRPTPDWRPGLAPGVSPAITGAAGRDGEVKAVSVLPTPGHVEVVIDLQGTVEVQDFTLASPARLVLDRRITLTPLTGSP